MNNSLTSMVLENFEEPDLPQKIFGRFNLLELLARNELGETFLLSEKIGGKRYVLKSFRYSNDDSSESELLNGLVHRGLPRFEQKIVYGQISFSLREYVDGVSLEEYVTERGVLDEATAIDVLVELCDIVGVLHSQPIPIIHRDIKPSNVIINPESKHVTLIDFGISRKYNANSSNDTTVFATQEFAPPEQFGFAQTDTRTDVYSLGILLRYLLTGGTKNTVTIPSGWGKITKKCTELAPNSRYQNADALKKALIWHKMRTMKKMLRFAAMLVMVLMFAVTYTLYAHFTYTEASLDIYVFNEPLIEAAVRRALNIGEDEPITYETLEAVTEIRIFSMFPACIIYADYEYELQYGNIHSLEDFRFMPNLQSLYLGRQPVYDLSPLVYNLQLSCIYLYRTNVSDISPLTQLASLERFRLRDSLVTDFSAIENMKNLYGFFVRWQDIGITSVRELGDLSRLNTLEIMNCPRFISLDGVQNIPMLRALFIANTGVQDFSLLNDEAALPNLIELWISPDMEQYLHTFTRDDVDVIIKSRS